MNPDHHDHAYEFAGTTTRLLLGMTACLRRYRDGWDPAGDGGRLWVRWRDGSMEAQPMTEAEQAALEWLDENEETR